MTLQTITRKELDIMNDVQVLVFAGTIYVIARVIINMMTLNEERKRREADLALAEAQSKVMTAKPLKDLADSLNFIMDFYIANEIVLIANGKMTEEEKNDILVEQTAKISGMILNNTSSELLRQFSYYVDVNPNPNEDDFVMYYIRKSVMTKLAYVLNARVDVEPKRTSPVKPNESDKK